MPFNFPKHTSQLTLIILTLTLTLTTISLLAFSRNQYLFIQALGIIFAYLSFSIPLIYLLVRAYASLKIHSRFIHVVFGLTLTTLNLMLLAFVIGTTWIGFSIASLCQDSQREYGGTCTQALTSLLQDDTRGFRVRNDAIWSLGQLQATSALPILEDYYTGQIPAREPLDQSISQYELKKAIRLLQGAPNNPAIFWRHAFPF